MEIAGQKIKKGLFFGEIIFTQLYSAANNYSLKS